MAFFFMIMNLKKKTDMYLSQQLNYIYLYIH